MSVDTKIKASCVSFIQWKMTPIFYSQQTDPFAPCDHSINYNHNNKDVTMTYMATLATPQTMKRLTENGASLYTSWLCTYTTWCVHLHQ